MRSSLSNNARLSARTGAALLAASVLLSACARSAAPLPQDYGSVTAPKPQSSEFSAQDQALTCPQVAAEIIRLEGQNRRAEAVIKSDRTQNQTAGYFAALFLVPIVAVDTNEEQVALLNQNQRRQDDLRRLKRAKAC